MRWSYTLLRFRDGVSDWEAAATEPKKEVQLSSDWRPTAKAHADDEFSVGKFGVSREAPALGGGKTFSIGKDQRKSARLSIRYKSYRLGCLAEDMDRSANRECSWMRSNLCRSLAIRKRHSRFRRAWWWKRDTWERVWQQGLRKVHGK